MTHNTHPHTLKSEKTKIHNIKLVLLSCLRMQNKFLQHKKNNNPKLTIQKNYEYKLYKQKRTSGSESWSILDKKIQSEFYKTEIK